ncbi:McrB family protein [Methylobacterium brachiatum]|uniref:McrB family protein n=1 Tax=Methylobacterium brachiatum TaxID=269660 RepID=UPI003314664B
MENTDKNEASAVKSDEVAPVGQVVVTEPSDESALNKLNKLFAQLMERYPQKGLGTSSMGKFDPIRRWLADELGLSEWARQTYAVGSSTAAHNFNSRWVQNNLISGNRVPFGAAFLNVPSDANETKLLASAMNANEHFVDGSRPTSFEAIITFIQRPGENSVAPYAIQTLEDSDIAQKLVALFPGTPITLVNWQGGTAKGSISTISAKVEVAPLSPEMLSKLREAFEEANYQASDDLAGRVISSLAAKPFLLLAGLSGTGKTLLALALARWLAAAPEQVQTVAVGADWTSTHHLIGYPDALDPTKYVRTPALELLLLAKSHPELPYFLILDEMNLSHVERYFSDFLSAMESREDIVLHGGPGAREGIPKSLPFPSNLFLVGTINVDETTYMFSPKVIDRANVIEFTVNASAMQSYLSGSADFSPAAIQGMGAGYGTALADAAGGSAGLEDLDSTSAAAFRAGILGLFEVLDRHGLQFGFRTVREIIRYVVANRQLFGEDWSAVSALDAQIVQRLLPRLNGDSAKLKPPLLALMAFCTTWSPALDFAPDVAAACAKAAEFDHLDQQAIRQACGELRATYPLTADKLARMLKRLAEQGYTTAIEA